MDFDDSSHHHHSVDAPDSMASTKVQQPPLPFHKAFPYFKGNDSGIRIEALSQINIWKCSWCIDWFTSDLLLLFVLLVIYQTEVQNYFLPLTQCVGKKNWQHVKLEFYKLTIWLRFKFNFLVTVLLFYLEVLSLFVGLIGFLNLKSLFKKKKKSSRSWPCTGPLGIQ